MSEPVLSYDVRMGGDNAAWQTLGDYALWTMHRSTAAAALHVWTLQRERPLELAPKSHALYNVPAGIPHRVEPLWGFWRISDGDTDIFQVTEAERVAHSILINTGSPAYRTDRVAWFCRACAAPLSETSFDVRRFGLPKFWEFARDEVAAFNADPERRTCGACGAMHPEGYDFAPREVAPPW